MSELSPNQIDTTFRNGSVTAVGVIVGFSLTFLSSWATTPAPWHWHDLAGIVPLAAGVGLQLLALSALLQTSSLQRAIYGRAVRRFLAGLVLVCLGLVGVVIANAMTVATRG